MISVTDFVSLPKVDAHNHLNLGMRYASYVPWAGFYIPDFPRKMSGLEEMHDVIGMYTRTRTRTAKDAQDLITLSIQDAIADGVTILEGSIDISFVHHCNNNIDTFLTMIEKILSKFSNSITFLPELGMGKTFDKLKIKKWAPACMESGLFKSIDLYGPEVIEGIDEFKDIFDAASRLNIKKKAHVGEFSDAKSVRDFIEYFDLDEVQHGIGAAQDEKVIEFIKKRNVRLNITPASNVMLSAVPSLEEHPIKKLVQSGVKVSIATDDLLFFNRSVSEQCADLVNAGLFTKQEVITLLANSVNDYKK
ncbi:MAG: adenosine deaminase [Spirochaetaceae bacterium]|nr:adenosine deaminase [Spirochaetaceae bacterium]